VREMERQRERERERKKERQIRHCVVLLAAPFKF